MVAAGPGSSNGPDGAISSSSGSGASSGGGASLDAGGGGSSSGGGSGSGGSGGATPPSCQSEGDGLTDCGASRESCCTSLEVTGGTFYRTYTNDGGGPTAEADPATVSSFRLDKYEVTVGRFRQFVAAWHAGWTPPAGSGKHTHVNGGRGLANGELPGTYETGWLPSDGSNVAPTDGNLGCPSPGTWTSDPGANEQRPINCETWYEAYAFCIWDGGFLPSEAEWEYAAAGGSQQREYPWSSTAPGTASQYAIYGCDYPSASGTCSNVMSIAPVGTAARGAGRWGQLDLAGNIDEWALDGDYGAYVNPCADCSYASPTSSVSSVRGLRGGAYYEPESGLLPPTRGLFLQTYRGAFFGLRCARTP